MIDMQLLNNALTALAIWSGAAVFAAISIVAIAAAMRRRSPAISHSHARATSHAPAARRARTLVAVHVPALR